MKQAHNITVDKELWIQLKQIAKDQNRNLSNLIETVLKDYLIEWEDKLRQDR